MGERLNKDHQAQRDEERASATLPGNTKVVNKAQTVNKGEGVKLET